MAVADSEAARKRYRRDLHRAVFLGEWERTKSLLLDRHPENSSLAAIIPPVLQIAVISGHLHMVEKLVELMISNTTADESDSILTTTTEEHPRTPLYQAAICGYTKIAEVLVRKNRHSLQIPDWMDGIFPLAVASMFGRMDTARYLYEVTIKETLIQENGRKSGATLINYGIWYEMYASRWLYGLVWSALDLLVPGIKSIRSKKRIHVQAIKVHKCVCSQISALEEQELKAAMVYDSLFIATTSGIVEIVFELIKTNPSLLYARDKQNLSILANAILCRQEKIFNLICRKGGWLNLLINLSDKEGNTMLHLVGRSPPSLDRNKMPAGAALQMQRELQWFQEVEKLVPSLYGELPNSKGLTPRKVFTDEHKDLVKKGEKWMKDTAKSCMVVATLIATFTFAAAFTAPGGFNQDLGFPIFLRYNLFYLFMISDVLSLFSSSSSLLMFLSIYTSRYEEEDFLELLPKRLIIGLSTLFFSILTMMVAFCATMFLILSEKHKWVSIPITFFAGVPDTLFFLLQFPLFLDMVRSMYGPGIFNKPKK